MKEEWDLIIKPQQKLLSLNLKEIWQYRDLLTMFVKRDVVTVYKQTILGPIWFFVQPIMTTLVYVVVFGNIAGIATDGIPKPLFYLSGIVIWNYFSECFLQTSDTFAQNQDMFGKVYFPRLIMPLSKVVSGLIKFFIQFTLFLIVYFYFVIKGVPVVISWSMLLIPYLIILMASLGLGFGLIFTSMTTKYRDLKFLVQFGVQLLMYATPIIYPMSLIEGQLKLAIALNPLAHVIEAFKYSFLGEGELSIIGLTYSTIFATVVLLIGILIFNKTEKSFVDTI
ncbi:ABC transporter permease [Aureispira sp. CCB-E]|uniref:ABC transporter permease n=1 Tax=Aureispira sp. CCB-E TaxID=3051121 RepID=UPI002868948D|nr:ABC transporter permease [Aureispira sp. CCB-E]WMX15203.1 ABC transporter permease [Aureispira sp. CCB-E]